jgi:hypothetical protein
MFLVNEIFSLSRQHYEPNTWIQMYTLRLRTEMNHSLI